MYIGAQGQDEANAFTIIVWDQLFQPSEVSIDVLETQTDDLYDVTQTLLQSASSDEYVIMSTLISCTHYQEYVNWILLKCHLILTPWIWL